MLSGISFLFCWHRYKWLFADLVVQQFEVVMFNCENYFLCVPSRFDLRAILQKPETCRLLFRKLCV